MPYTQEMFIRDHYPEWSERIQIAKDQGKNEGRAEGIAEGKLIGEILMAQRILRQRLYSEGELKTKSLDELKRIFADFEARLTF